MEALETLEMVAGRRINHYEYVGDLRYVFQDGPFESDDSNLQTRCIYHDDDVPSLSVYKDHVYCHACGTRRSPEEFLVALGNHTPEFELSYARRRSALAGPDILPASQAETFHQWLLGPYSHRLEWLYARGLRLDTIQANKLGHTAQAFTIPVYADGGLASIRYRRDDYYSDDKRKYWGTAGRNEAMPYFPNRPLGAFTEGMWATLVLCEGEFDALRLVQEGAWSCSFTNGVSGINEENLAKLPAGARVAICLDMDEPGMKAARRAKEILGDRAAIVRWSPSEGKDVTEYLLRRPFSFFVNAVLRSMR